MERSKLFNKLVYIAFIMIFIGMTLQLEQVIEDNEKKQEIIERQADELIRCRAENENLEKIYEKRD